MTMNKFTAFALGLFMAFGFGFFSGDAYASFPPVQSNPTSCTVAPCYQYKLSIDDRGVWFETASSACSSYAAHRGWGVVSYTETYCTVQLNPTSQTGIDISRAPHAPWPPTYSCPANSTLVGASCTCNAGFDQSGSSCVPHVNQCTTRPPGITNFTVAYVRTLMPDDYDAVGGVNTVPSNRQVCDSGCTVSLGEAVAAWRSETPTAQGLYRLSLDFQATASGAECTAATSSVAPLTPPPTCPGFVGQVNGKTGCFGTAANPITTTKASSLGVDAKPGNPSAGNKPATGEGSGSTGAGRTPATGDGGNAGGPAGAAGNASGYSGGSGTVTKPSEGQEQAACGAPGQPKCAIDETGTPRPVGTGENDGPFGTAEGILGAAKTGVQNAITDQKQLQAPPWTWTFSLPSGCTPFVMGAFNMSLDICQYQPMVHDLMSVIWILVGIFAAVGMAQRTLRGS